MKIRYTEVTNVDADDPWALAFDETEELILDFS